MRRTIYLAISSVGLFSFVGTLNAQRSPKGDPWARISQYDKDGDGKVTAAEFDGPAHMMERFDADKDGTLTKEEVGNARKPGQGGQGGGRPDNAPQEGDEAPEVSAKKQGGDEVVDLSAVKKTTVLVFGSYT